jgi:hypothetical protein
MVPRLSRRRARLLVAGLAALAAVVSLVVGREAFAHHSLNHDEAVYLQQAELLLEGRIYLRPPVEDAFRPWFFVESERGLYAKYAPVTAAVFALGKLAGGFRLALAAVAAGLVALTYATVTEAFDRDRGVLAAALLAASPMFLVQTAVFLPYAPTLLFELLFAWAYLRCHRTGRPGWGLVAGVGVGVAFFARPFTAVLFAAPFVVHALWSLAREPRRELPRLLPTAFVGLLGVGVALGYNALVTGDPFLFPYEAFAPRDGLGFGERAILGYERDYTPLLALEANARVLGHLFGNWVVAGPLGTLLAAVGIANLATDTEALSRVGAWRARAARTDGAGDASTGQRVDGEPERGRAHEFSPDIDREVVLAGLFVSVALGNVFFWGNLNVLGALDVAGDGLVDYLGPHYHFDLLVPTAAFAAHGAFALVSWWGDLATRRGLPEGATVTGLVLGVLVVTGGAVGAAAVPLSDNHAIGDQLDAAYEPVEPPPEDAVVFLPTPYGDWLNHPFQLLGNDPDYDGETVYALRERQFAVVDAYPERDYYRYTYRGEWAPFRGEPVTPRLQQVEAVSGPQVRVGTELGLPASADRASIRVDGGRESAYYAVRGDPETLTFDVVVDADGVRLVGDRVVPLNESARVPLPERGIVTVETFVDYSAGTGFSYRAEIPVAAADGSVRALTPYLEVCRDARLCGDEAAYVPDESRPGVFVRTALESETASRDRSEDAAWS